MNAVENFIHKMEIIEVIEAEAQYAIEFSDYRKLRDNLCLFMACLTCELVVEEDACLYVYETLNMTMEQTAMQANPFLANLANSKISHAQLCVAMKIYDMARIHVYD